AGVRRKANGSFPGVGPRLSKIVAAAQERAPIAVRRGPYAVLAVAVIVRNRVNRVPVEIRTADLPTGALSVGAQHEGSLCGPHQQEKISLPDVNGMHLVEDRGVGPLRSGGGSAEITVPTWTASRADCTSPARW